ncbi:MAG: choice-of-anchor D domain-containing protein, partial [Deltaproteobacteria bacterium]|nr:choice-of-anchor D domain-containing protein [Deltaproteobacteria bacterium]
ALTATGSPGGTVVAALAARGITGKLEISPSAQDLGTAAVGDVGADLMFTVTNTGAAESGPLVITANGADPVDFQRTAVNTCSGLGFGNRLPPGGTCVFAIQFQPYTPGAKTATLEVTGLPGGTAIASVSAVAVARARVTTVHTHRDFGTVALGDTTSVDLAFVNEGGLPIAANQLILGDASFTIDASTCANTTLDPGAGCTATVRFAPTTTGAKSATLAVGGLLVTVGGTATPTTALAIAPTAHDFTSAAAGTTTAPHRFTVTNRGTSTAGPLATRLLGLVGTQFTPVADACANRLLAPSASCTIDVAFAPAGRAAAAQLVVSTPSLAFVTAGLAGHGRRPAHLAIAQTSKDFGSVVVGAPTPAYELTIVNDGDEPSGIPALATTGAFAVDASTCTAPLAPGTTCGARVRFTPMFPGVATAELAATAEPGGTATTPLSGQGVAHALGLEVTPSTIEWRPTMVGDAGNLGFARTLRLRNTGTTTIDGISAGTIGPQLTEYSARGNPPSGTCTKLVPGEACDILVTLQPRAANRRIASLRLAAAGRGEVHAGLAGTGFRQWEVFAVDDRPTPAVAEFGATPVDAPFSNEIRIAVRNNSRIATPVSLQADYGTPPQFVTVVGPPSGAIPVGATFTIRVRFKPTSTGVKTGSIKVLSDIIADAQAVQLLTGTGVAP